MESMYFCTNTSEDKLEYLKDEEIINLNQDRLATKLNECYSAEDADYYATSFLNAGIELYNQELREDIKRKRRLNRILSKLFSNEVNNECTVTKDDD